MTLRRLVLWLVVLIGVFLIGEVHLEDGHGQKRHRIVRSPAPEPDQEPLPPGMRRVVPVPRP